jgi:hypothetical protein
MLYCTDTGKDGNNVVLTRMGNIISDELKTIEEIGFKEDEIILAIERNFTDR